MKYHHVCPIDDLIEHSVDRHEPPCACNPEYDYDHENGYCLIIHAAMDRREVWEDNGKTDGEGIGGGF